MRFGIFDILLAAAISGALVYGIPDYLPKMNNQLLIIFIATMVAVGVLKGVVLRLTTKK